MKKRSVKEHFYLPPGKGKGNYKDRPRRTMKGATMPPQRAATETRPIAELRMVVGKISPLWM